MTGDSADSFTLSLGTDTAGTNIGTIEGITNGTTINYANWQPNTTYYWFIEAINCAGSTSSAVWSFTTAQCSELTAPTAATAPMPADGAPSVNLNASQNSLSFSWTAGDPGDNFILNLGTSNPPTQSFNNFDNGGTITGLSTDTTYYWSVDAVNCFGTTTGTVWSFTTSNVLSVEDSIADVFSVSPNPVSEILNIKSSQPLNYVSVINLLGQEVVTFNKNELINNSINLSNITNGLYLIRITAGDKTQTIRIVKE